MTTFSAFTTFTTKESYLQAISDWKRTYAEISQGQRDRKNQIRSGQIAVSDIPVFSYDWDLEQQDAWWAQYGKDHGTARKNHSKLAIANRNGAEQATEMLATLKEMKRLAGEQSATKGLNSQSIKVTVKTSSVKLGKSTPCVLTA